MSGFGYDLTNAVRSLWRSPVYAAFAAGTIALGIGTATTLYSAVNRVVLNPVEFPEADRVMGVWRSRGSFTTSATRDQARLIEKFPRVFEVVSVTSRSQVALSAGGKATSVTAARVDDAWAALSSPLSPILGRGFGPEDVVGDGAAVVALDEELWQARFGGDPGILGRTIRIDGDPHTVVGVFPGDLVLPAPGAMQTDLWMPLGEAFTGGGLHVFARLGPDVEVDAAMERTKAGAGEDGESADWTMELMPIGEMDSRPLRDPIRALAVAVGLLLLIACGNVASLLLARGDQRRRETAVRAALGADRRRLVREAVFESLLLALVGGVGGVALAALAVSAIGRLRPDGFHLLGGLALDLPVLSAAFLTTILTAVLFGVLPASHRALRDPGEALGERGSSGGRDSSRLRHGLLVAEVALSFALLVAATQLMGTLTELGGRETGFAHEQLAEVRVDVPEWHYPEPETREAVLVDLTRRIAALPGVNAVTRGNGVPPQTGIFFAAPEVEGVGMKEEAASEVFFGNSVSAGYFEAIGQDLIEGRTFSEEEWRSGAEVMLMGRRTGERFFPSGDAIGGRFRLSGANWHTVIGIVEDVRATAHAGDNDYGQIYYPAGPGYATTFIVRSDDPAGAVAAVRSLLAENAPELTVNSATTVEARYRQGLARERLLTSVLAAFGVIAAILTAVGLYGVVTWITARRTREFGIRISLGAERHSVFRAVLAGGLVTVVPGVVLGALLTSWGIRLLGSGIVGLERPSVPVFIGTGLALSLVALAACAAPAWRAAGTDPVEALRAE